jgi:hypothetical protein
MTFQAFGYITSLQTVIFKGTKEPESCADNVFNGCPTNVEFIIPNGYSGDDFCGREV